MFGDGLISAPTLVSRVIFHGYNANFMNAPRAEEELNAMMNRLGKLIHEFKMCKLRQGKTRANSDARSLARTQTLTLLVSRACIAEVRVVYGLKFNILTFMRNYVKYIHDARKCSPRDFFFYGIVNLHGDVVGNMTSLWMILRCQIKKIKGRRKKNNKIYLARLVPVAKTFSVKLLRKIIQNLAQLIT